MANKGPPKAKPIETTFVTWNVEKYNPRTKERSTERSKVHILATTNTTMCGRTIPLETNWWPPHIVTHATFKKRPCLSCAKSANVLNVRSKPMPNKVNFAAVADFEALAAGEYEVTVTNPRVDNSKTSGQPTAYIDFLVNETNQKIFKSYSLQPKALWALKRDLTRIGVDPSILNSENADLDDILASVDGAACTVICSEPHYWPVDEKTKEPTEDSKLQTTFKEVKG